MNERQIHTNPETLSPPPRIEALLGRLEEANKRLLEAQTRADNVNYRDAWQYAYEDARQVREELCEAVMQEVLRGDMLYDDAITLLKRHGFKCEDGAGADFEPVLGSLTTGDDVLLKRAHGYFSDDVLGKLAGEPVVVPRGINEHVRPAIVARIITDYSDDLEFIQLRKGKITGKFSMPGVVVGKEAIDNYLTERF